MKNNYSVIIIVLFIILNDYINQCYIAVLIVVYNPPLEIIIYFGANVSVKPLNFDEMFVLV